MNDNTVLWWVIKGPVVGSIMVSVLGIKSWEETGDLVGRWGRRRKKEVATQTSFFPFHGYVLFGHMDTQVI